MIFWQFQQKLFVIVLVCESNKTYYKPKQFKVNVISSLLYKVCDFFEFCYVHFKFGKVKEPLILACNWRI